MSPGQPFSIKALLPAGMSADDLYTLLTGLVAFGVVLIVGNSLTQRDTMGPRIRALQERRVQMKTDALVATRARKRKDGTSSMSFMKTVVNKLQLIKNFEANKAAGLLISAGYRSKDAIYIYAFAKLAVPLGLLAVTFLLVDYNFSNPLAMGWKLIVPVAALYIGMKMPDVLVVNARNKRYGELQKSLADTLDLMLICAEAGLSLSAALDRVSRELRLAYPIMGEELALTSLEMGFLPDRKQALVNLTERAGLPEIRGIVSVLIQTEKYGTPISQALRVLSNEFREQRMLRAEQKAARLPAIMTVPMIIFILPTLFIVVISPAIIRVLGIEIK